MLRIGCNGFEIYDLKRILENKNLTQEQKIETINKAYRDCESLVQSVHALSESTEREIKLLRGHLADQDKLVRPLQERNFELETENEELIRTKERLQEDLKKKTSENESYKEKNHRTRMENIDLRGENTRLTTRNAELKRENNDQQAKFNEITANYTDAITALGKENDEIRAQLDECYGRNQTLLDEQKAAKTAQWENAVQIETLKQQLESLGFERKRAKDELAYQMDVARKLEPTINELKTQLNQQQQENLKLSEELKARMRQCQSDIAKSNERHEKAVRKLEADHREEEQVWQSDRQRFVDQIQSQSVDLANTKQADIDRIAAQLQICMEQKQAELGKLASELHACQADQDRLVQDWKQKYNQCVADKSTESVTQQARIQELEQSLQTILVAPRQKLKMCQAQLTSLQSDLSIVWSQLQDAQDSVQTCEQKANREDAKWKYETDQLQTQLREQQSEVRHLRNVLGICQDGSVKLQEQHKQALQTEADKRLELVQQHQDEIKRVQDQLSAAERANIELSVRNKELRTQNADESKKLAEQIATCHSEKTVAQTTATRPELKQKLQRLKRSSDQLVRRLLLSR